MWVNSCISSEPMDAEIKDLMDSQPKISIGSTRIKLLNQNK